MCKRSFVFPAALGAMAACLTPVMAAAAEGAPAHLPGAELSVYWAIPFACMLLSIALGPMIVPHFWDHHFGKVSVFWGLAFLVPCAIVYGVNTAVFEGLHSILLDYIPFIVLLFALFTVAGGVRLKGTLVGTPAVNTAMLGIGTVLASWMGTTGAAMLLIRPLLRANAHRKYRAHQVVFFIFMVANIGGSLTPLGDPPLFLGYLKGVSFFWTLEHLFHEMLFAAGILLVLFYIIDKVTYIKEGSPKGPNPAEAAQNGEVEKFGLDGKINLLLLVCIVLAVLVSGMVDLGVWGTVMGIQLHGSGIARDLVLLVIAGLPWVLTSRRSRSLNGFTWAPILEVGKLFFGIFLSMIPAIAIVRAGTDGALANLINLVFHDGHPVNAAFFWLTGALSSFLDNAPTYVVFFNTAGGDPAHLMTDMASTLAAISCGAVFMGANTYIGNAPNFMVRSIAEENGVPMPSFFDYMGWSCGILVPIFILMTFLFFI